MTMVPYTRRAGGRSAGSVTSMFKDRIFDGSVSNSNALYDYYSDNDAIVRTDPIVRTLVAYLRNNLFGAGVQFMRGKSILKAPPDFDTSIFTPFLFQTLEFIISHGVLVFYIYRDPDVDEEQAGIPMVPDWNDIRVSCKPDERTRHPVATAEWCDDKHTERLWVFNTGNPFGVHPNNDGAPIDAIKDMLRQYYYNLEMHVVTKDNNSRPPIILQSPNTSRDAATLANDLGSYDAELERNLMRNMHTIGLDDLNLARIRRAADPNRRTYGATTSATSSTPMPWWARVKERTASPPESRFMYIPHGLQYVNGQQNIVDGNFSKEQSEIIQSVYNAFGIPYSAILTTGTQQTNTSVELHKTMLVDTLRVWFSLYTTVLTDVYRLMYDVKTFPFPVSMESDGDYAAAAKAAAAEARGPRVATTVHLMAAFITTPEQATALYQEGIISWETFQDMRLESVGLPASLADRSIPPAARLAAQTQSQLVQQSVKAPPSSSKKK